MGVIDTQSLLKEAVQNRVQFVGLTVDQYDWLINAGKLEEDTTTELINGFIVKKDRSAFGEDPMTVGDQHRFTIIRLTKLAPQFESHGCFLQSQQPIALPPGNEPEPDVAIIRGSEDDFRDHKPGPRDVIFVLEVSDSSVKRDTTTKLRVYARAKIPVYIVINLQDDIVLVHQKPSADKYTKITRLRRGEVLQMPTADKSLVTVDIAKLL